MLRKPEHSKNEAVAPKEEEDVWIYLGLIPCRLRMIRRLHI